MRRLALAAAVAALLGAAAAQTSSAARAFVPDDPLFPKQWYLTQDKAFDYWPDLPVLAPVRVAVVDSGVDYGHPDLTGQIVGGKSFIGDDWKVDSEGHGTFVAGLIAAATNNTVGIAGLGFPAQLLIAKVVPKSGTISTDAEARAIRWAADNGARVINLSLGGLRDPSNPDLDLYSPVEESAVDYAYRKGAVVVAAVGNGDEAPTEPWRYASYPAALPHVIGVSALTRDGNVPDFSNRDAVYNDLAAPGDEILSTFPRALTAKYPACVDQGYSDCASPDYRRGDGTSFAAPQVSAAAALLIAARPGLKPDQVADLIERSADDVNASTGCKKCPLLRDSLSGWGRLDVAAALGVALGGGPLPVADSYETNDEAGARSAILFGQSRTIHATIDYWDDPVDVYRVYVRRGQRLYAAATGPVRTAINLMLWKPGTTQVEGVTAQLSRRVAQVRSTGRQARLAQTATVTGWYDLELKIATPGFGPYTLSFGKKLVGQ